jgi:predicted nucleotidyltransferase
VNVLLSGIVGSTAYGLAREGSDVDRIGVFVAPTIDVAGLDWHGDRESAVSTKPDSTHHEVGKYLRLALKCNPTITELMWLPGDLIEQVHPFHGARLIDLREAFLSEHAVKAAYGGYARQQASRLRNRGDGSFSADTRKRTTKHARHLLRLLRQGRELLATGRLTVRVPNPEDYFAFDEMTPEQMLDVYEREDALFAETVSVLPSEPDRERVREYLSDVRAAFLWTDREAA